MSVELKVPHVGESIYEVTIGEWLKREGDFVRKDEPVVALETDKASLEVPAPVSGTLQRLLKQPGESAAVGETIAHLVEGEAAAPAAAAPAADANAATVERVAASLGPVPGLSGSGRAMTMTVGAPVAEVRAVMPAARRLLDENGLRPQDITPTGPGGRLLKEDVLRHIELANAPAPPAAAPTPVAAPRAPAPAAPAGPFTPHAAPVQASGPRQVEAIPVTPVRRRIAERLVESQQTTASLTTFNEVDMSAVYALRAEFKESFEKRYGVKLGLMSFFVKAAIEALKEIPQLNAQLDGDRLLYHHYYDIGVAVGGGKGLVVPVLRNAERLSFAETELAIRDFAVRAKANKIKLDELQGGTFTISNGGVYGSLLSTPILNPPQSGILGMHGIQDRPVVRDGQIVVRPMMYVALTYDHRLVDGRESVTFLRRVKDCVENPARILLEV